MTADVTVLRGTLDGVIAGLEQLRAELLIGIDDVEDELLDLRLLAARLAEPDLFYKVTDTPLG